MYEFWTECYIQGACEAILQYVFPFSSFPFSLTCTVNVKVNEITKLQAGEMICFLLNIWFYLWFGLKHLKLDVHVPYSCIAQNYCAK